MERESEMTMTVLCTQVPESTMISGVFSRTVHKIGEEVSLRLADKNWSFLAYAKITGSKPDPKWPDAFRYSLEVIDDDA